VTPARIPGPGPDWVHFVPFSSQLSRFSSQLVGLTARRTYCLTNSHMDLFECGNKGLNWWVRKGSWEGANLIENREGESRPADDTTRLGYMEKGGWACNSDPNRHPSSHTPHLCPSVGRKNIARSYTVKRRNLGLDTDLWRSAVNTRSNALRDSRFNSKFRD